MTREEHDTLIELKQDVKWLKKMMENHLEHHKRLAYVLVGVTAGSILTALVSLVR